LRLFEITYTEWVQFNAGWVFVIFSLITWYKWNLYASYFLAFRDTVILNGSKASISRLKCENRYTILIVAQVRMAYVEETNVTYISCCIRVMTFGARKQRRSQTIELCHNARINCSSFIECISLYTFLLLSCNSYIFSFSRNINQHSRM